VSVPGGISRSNLQWNAAVEKNLPRLAMQPAAAVSKTQPRSAVAAGLPGLP